MPAASLVPPPPGNPVPLTGNNYPTNFASGSLDGFDGVFGVTEYYATGATAGTLDPAPTPIPAAAWLLGSGLMGLLGLRKKEKV